MREMCRLQTLPDDFEIMGGITAIQRQLGNAVPSALSEMLGLEIRRQLLGSKRVRTDMKLIPEPRECPPAEPVANVPTKYRAAAA